jgi:formylglycine-generating enzyme required for sulfatase activity
MRKILIAVLCAAAAASQALAQSACSAPDGALLEVDNYAALTKKLSTIDQKAFVKDEWETEREFAARVEPIVEKVRSSLDLGRYYTLKSTGKPATTYDIERGVLKVDFESVLSYVSRNSVSDYQSKVMFDISYTKLKERLWPYKSEAVSHQIVDVKPEKQKEVFFSANALAVETWEYWLPPRSRQDQERCTDDYPALVLGSECRPSDFPMELPLERERARKIKDKLQVAFVFKPRPPFYEKALDHFVYAEPPYPMNVETLRHNVYGAVYCAVLLDDEGRKMATLYTGYRPASEEQQRAEAAARAEKEKAEAAARAAEKAEAAARSEKKKAEAAVRHKAAIAKLQTALIDRGYEPGTTDGEIREATVLALESFSSASGYSLVGVDLADVVPGRINALTSAVRDTPIPDPKRGQVFNDCAVCPSMVVVPAGSFTMGSTKSEDGWAWGPRREVTIGSDFAVGRYEVTWAEWNACVADRGCEDFVFTKQEEVELRSAVADKGTLPVRKRSWEDAQAYVSWLSRKTGKTYRLLSEAEWEYSARAGTTTPFSFGSTISAGQANYNSRATTPVGSFPANAFGLYDMHGNVKEWTQDCWSKNYRGAPKDGSARTSGVVDCQWRVVRGGSYGSPPEDIRSSARWLPRSNESTGFRVARTLGAD